MLPGRDTNRKVFRMIYTLLSVIAGALIAVEASTNGALAKRTGHPIHAAIIAFVVGLVALVLVSLLVTRTVPGPSKALNAPAWTLLGGLYGATFVCLAALAAPHTGALTFGLALLAGQALLGAVLDHFGLLENTVRAITPTRAIGMVLLVAGVFLVQRQS